MHRVSIVFLIIFTVSLGLLSCGGEDGSDSSASIKETARIVGTVEELLMSSLPEKNQSLLADVKEMFLFVMPANAQDGELCGIIVKAIQNGEVVATGETNCDGKFELNELDEGPTTLVFENDFFSDSLVLDVPAGGTLEIKVSLDDDEMTEVSTTPPSSSTI